MPSKCIWAVAPENRLCHICKMVNCAERVPRPRRRGKMMGQLRLMDVGQKILLPADRYGSIRSSASRLGKVFGTIFTCKNTDEGILVTRIY